MMAMRSALGVIPRLAGSSVAAAKEVAAPRSSRFFSDGKGRVLSEEERAAENIYIQKMERERMEKLKKKQEKENAEAEKAKTEKNASRKTTWRELILLKRRMIAFSRSYTIPGASPLFPALPSA
ncbi:hypothetical protein MUK42_10101 [Musa troglodytarum]|uniref:ATPase inhibitor n=1 Tax=Musa troglodytarum TaxID=320322 RepID=A0A9E7ECA8_9LILI|nr:hypothetical protein MUK42_10101 [Musa troglodytarum]